MRSGASSPDLLSLLGVQLPVTENPGDSGFEGKFTFPSWRLDGDGLRLPDALGAGTPAPGHRHPVGTPSEGTEEGALHKQGKTFCWGLGAGHSPLFLSQSQGRASVVRVALAQPCGHIFVSVHASFCFQ